MPSRRPTPTILFTAIAVTVVILPWAINGVPGSSRQHGPVAEETVLSQQPLAGIGGTRFAAAVAASRGVAGSAPRDTVVGRAVRPGAAREAAAGSLAEITVPILVVEPGGDAEFLAQFGQGTPGWLACVTGRGERGSHPARRPVRSDN